MFCHRLTCTFVCFFNYCLHCCPPWLSPLHLKWPWVSWQALNKWLIIIIIRRLIKTHKRRLLKQNERRHHRSVCTDWVTTRHKLRTGKISTGCWGETRERLAKINQKVARTKINTATNSLIKIAKANTLSIVALKILTFLQMVSDI